MDVGRDNGLPVARAYAATSLLSLHRIGEEGRLQPQAGSHEDEKALHEAGAHVAAAHGISA